MADELSLFDPARAVLPKRAPEPADYVEALDNATGKTVRLAPEEAEARFKAGTINLPTFKPVSVAHADGTVEGVDPGHISDALDHGDSLISDQTRHAEELRQEYGGGKGMAIAGAQGFGSALTFGVSDALLTDEQKEIAQAAGELHPIAHTAGEVAGLATGAALMPGASGGMLAEEGAAGLLARASGGALTKEATGLGARMVAKGVGLGARGAFEGSELGLQGVLSAQALDKDPPELTGEKIIAGMGTGALYGALGGAAAGAGTEALATGLRGASKKLAPYLEQQADRAAWRDINSGKGLTKQAMRRVPGGPDALGRVARDEGLVDPFLTVEEQFSKAEQAHERVGQEIRDLYAQSGAMGSPKELLGKLDDLIAETSKDAGREDVVSGLETFKESLAEKLYARAKGIEPRPPTPQEAQMAAYEQELLVKGADKARIAEVRAIRDRLRAERLNVTLEEGEAHLAELRVPLSDLWEQKRALGRLVYDESKVLEAKGKTDVLRQFYSHFGDYIAETGEAEASAAGREFATPLRALNKRFQALSMIKDSLEDKVAGNLTNRVFSLTDSIAGSAGGTGAVTALATGHPLGAAASMLAGPAHKFIRERGQRIAAYLYGHVGGLETISAHVAQVDTAIERAVAGYVEREPPRISGVFPRAEAAAPAEAATREEKHEEGDLEDRFASRSGSVRELAKHPDLSGAADAQLASVTQHHPAAGAEAAKTVQRAIAYLAKELPVSPTLDPLRPGLETPPSRAEMTAWLRKERIVDNPTLLIHDLHAGHVDPDGAAAARDVYPALYQDVRTQLLHRLQESPRAITRQERLQLAEAFEIEATPDVAPTAIAARQDAYAQMEKQAAAAAPARKRGRGRLAESSGLASASERLERGGD